MHHKSRGLAAIARKGLTIFLASILVFDGVPTAALAEALDAADTVVEEALVEEEVSEEELPEEGLPEEVDSGEGLPEQEPSDQSEPVDSEEAGEPEALPEEATEEEEPVDDEREAPADGAAQVDAVSDQEETSAPEEVEEPALTAQADEDLVVSGEWGECSWSLDSEGLLRIWPTDATSGQLADSMGYETGDSEAYFPWWSYASSVVSVAIDEGVILPDNCQGMFSHCEHLSFIDVSRWDTSSVTDMSCLFSGCESLTSLDVSNWDTSSVTDMSGLFQSCLKVTSLDVSNWDTSSVTDMGFLFSRCRRLTFLDFTSWDTSLVVDVQRMFQECKALESIDVSGWDTSRMKNMNGLFLNCESISSLDVSGWVTSRVTDMAALFANCQRVLSLDVSGWDTSNVTEMGSIFKGCQSLTYLDVSGWNTSSATFMTHTFSGCPGLESLDVSGWDTSSVTDMIGLFNGCSGLTSLDLTNWDTSLVWRTDNMFTDCTSLAELSVGESFDTAKAFPLPQTARGWWSSANEEWFTLDEIQAQRAFVADTYHVFIPLDAASIESVPPQTYTGLAIEPSPTVELGGTTLAAGTDYELSYENNVDAGTATVTLTGIGDFTGSKAVNFTINKASLSKATVTVKAQTYTGKALKPAPTVKVGGRTLKSGTDYTLAYKNNTKVGTATVTVKGKGNYAGTKSATFKITKPSVAKATVSKVANQKYDGVAKRPSPTVKVGGRTLKKGTDYTLTYKNNQKPGTATVTIKGKGNYAGSKNVTFKIVAMAGAWKGSGSKWWYQWKDGSYPKSVFLDISGKTYYFDASGYCVYGWRQINKKYYYFESSGAMAKSKWVGNYWLKADGTMATSEWVDGGKYWVGANGAWVKGKTR